MQENLARGLSVVSRAVSNRSLPVLTNVLLKTEDAGLKLTATNLEIGITYWVPGKIEVDGATSVPARLLTDLVNSLPGGEPIDLELGDGETLHIRSGRFESNIKGISADDFPTVQTAGERPITRIPQNVLRQALEETAFAAASDEARPILTGVLARFEGDQLTLAAADNYRIAVKTITILDPVEETSVVIPARALHELSRVLADTDDPVSIVLAHARNQILFHLEGIDLVSRLIDGQYPELPVGPAGEPLDAGRPRSRGAPPGRPAGGAHRPRVGEHRQARRRARRRPRDHGQRQRRGRRPRRPDRGGGRGRRDDDRLQRPLPGRRPDERRRRAVRARAERAAVAGRVQAGRRRPLRPRRDAAPDDVLTSGHGVATRRTWHRGRACSSSIADLQDLRGYGSAELAFGPGPQLVVGPNAAGKTSLLEAIVLLAWGRSHRTSDRRRADPLGRRRRPRRGPRRAGDDRGRARRGPATGGAGARKRIRVNGVARRAPALVGLLRIVLFAPEEMLLVVGSPGLRRAAIDQLAAQRSPAYLRDLATYTRTLQQRNSLLRAIREEQATRAELRFWDETFLDAGGGDRRRRACGCSTDLAAPLAAAHAEIAPEEAAAAALAVRYVTNAPALPGESPRDALARRLVETAEKEVWNGSTLIGPHRDDVVFELDGRDLAGFASRGQQRTAILAFKLAELDLLTAPGRPPAAPAARRRLLASSTRSAASHLVRRIAELPQAFVTTTTLGRPRPGPRRRRDAVGGRRRTASRRPPRPAGSVGRPAGARSA